MTNPMEECRKNLIDFSVVDELFSENHSMNKAQKAVLKSYRKLACELVSTIRDVETHKSQIKLLWCSCISAMSCLK